MTADAPTQMHRLLLFGAAERLYACEIEAVREIIPTRPATRLPGAPEYVLGLINLRGTLVTVVDLARRLGRRAADAGEGSIVLVEVGPKVVGLAVDDVRDVQAVASEAIDAADASVAEQAAAGVVRGVAHLAGEVAVLVDVRAIVRDILLSVGGDT